MRVLNYLDDWFILAQSRDMLASHIDKLLRHLEFLRLCVNMSKSILALRQSIMYLGVCFHKKRWRCALNSQERLAAILSMRNFRPGSLLHLHPLQFWLKSRVPLDSVDIGPFAHRGLPLQHRSSAAVAQRWHHVSWSRRTHRHESEEQCSRAYRLLGYGQLEQRHVLIRTDNMSVVSYINHQEGIWSKAL